MRLRNKKTKEIIVAEFWLVKFEDGKYKPIQRFKSDSDAEALDDWEELYD